MTRKALETDLVMPEATKAPIPAASPAAATPVAAPAVSSVDIELPHGEVITIEDVPEDIDPKELKAKVTKLLVADMAPREGEKPLDTIRRVESYAYGRYDAPAEVVAAAEDTFKKSYTSDRDENNILARAKRSWKDTDFKSIPGAALDALSNFSKEAAKGGIQTPAAIAAGAGTGALAETAGAALGVGGTAVEELQNLVDPATAADTALVKGKAKVKIEKAASGVKDLFGEGGAAGFDAGRLAGGVLVPGVGVSKAAKAENLVGDLVSANTKVADGASLITKKVAVPVLEKGAKLAEEAVTAGGSMAGAAAASNIPILGHIMGTGSGMAAYITDLPVTRKALTRILGEDAEKFYKSAVGKSVTAIPRVVRGAARKVMFEPIEGVANQLKFSEKGSSLLDQLAETASKNTDELTRVLEAADTPAEMLDSVASNIAKSEAAERYIKRLQAVTPTRGISAATADALTGALEGSLLGAAYGATTSDVGDTDRAEEIVTGGALGGLINSIGQASLKAERKRSELTSKASKEAIEPAAPSAVKQPTEATPAAAKTEAVPVKKDVQAENAKIVDDVSKELVDLHKEYDKLNEESGNAGPSAKAVMAEHVKAIKKATQGLKPGSPEWVKAVQKATKEVTGRLDIQILDSLATKPKKAPAPSASDFLNLI